MRVFISAGEPSGDLHGGNLVRQLTAEGIECVGFGGPKMQAAGCQLYHELTRYAVMFLQALRWVPRLWGLYRQADRIFASGQIDAVVLIDFPGFHWWLARAAKRHRVPVFYYGVPQMWAWLPWRVRKLRRLVDHVICKLPFEVPWFAARGVRAHYVGHPYFDELTYRSLDQDFLREYDDPRGPLVTLLPGSRDQEVAANLPWLLEAAARIRAQVPEASFAVACYKQSQAHEVQQWVQRQRLEIDVFVQRTPELIALSSICLACSGSVSLELMYHEKPSLIVYRLNRLQALFKRLAMTCRFITLVNLLAVDDISRRASRPGEETEADGSVPFPEFAWVANPATRMAEIVVSWLRDPAELERRRAQLRQLRLAYGQPGATDRAARYIIQRLRPEQSSGGPIDQVQESVSPELLRPSAASDTAADEELVAGIQAAAAAAHGRQWTLDQTSGRDLRRAA